jgi:hypothetical protein
MKKITTIFLIASGFGLLTVVVSFLTPSPAPGQGTSAPVTVVNTAANPVPTTALGTTLVAVRGTPTVNVASGTVRVGNSVTNPVEVRNVNDATSLYEQRLVFNIDPGNQQNNGSFSNMPTGKRLVIEHISVSATVPSGQRITAYFTSSITTSVGGLGGGLNFLVMQLQGTYPLGTGPVDVFTASQPMRIYTDSAPVLIGNRTDIVGTATVDATISGYVVNP